MWKQPSEPLCHGCSWPIWRWGGVWGKARGRGVVGNVFLHQVNDFENVLWKHLFQMAGKKRIHWWTFQINYDIFHCLIKLLTAAVQKQALEVFLHKIQDSGSKNLFDFSFLARTFCQILATVMEKRRMLGCQKHPRDLYWAEQTLILCQWPILPSHSAGGRPLNIQYILQPNKSNTINTSAA